MINASFSKHARYSLETYNNRPTKFWSAVGATQHGSHVFTKTEIQKTEIHLKTVIQRLA